MARIGLVRPDSKAANYQNLSSISAVEPPHWMAVRATDLLLKGHTVSVHDCAVDGPDIKLAACDRFEIWPSGVHPSAFIQEQAGAADAIKRIGPDEDIEVIDHLNFNPVGTSPMWQLFDLKKYRAHNWHCWGFEDRQPYGTVNFSISCPYQCKFCTVKRYYRRKYQMEPIGKIMHDLEYLAGHVNHVKIMDEIAVRPTPEFEAIIDMILSKFKGEFNFWGYGRVDTVPGNDMLTKMKGAGLNWICLGIESGSYGVRTANRKGKFSNQTITDEVHRLQDHGIAVLGNYMYGFPEDTKDSMIQTWHLAYQLQCEYSNFYCVVPYPGTEIYTMAEELGWELPQTPSQFAQMAFDFKPLRTHQLSAKDVLAYRDWCWFMYHSRRGYIDRLRKQFGEESAGEMADITRIEVKRKELNGQTWSEHYDAQEKKRRGGLDNA